MTIRKGDAWGEPIGVESDIPIASSDVEISQLYRTGEPAICVTGGDLWRSLGGAPVGVSERLGYPIDVLEVIVGGSSFFAAAHVVCRRIGWAGEFFVGMNASHSGHWNLGPKAHPNDGLVDVTFGSLPLRQRLLARQRVGLGTHVPHPLLTTRRTRHVDHQFDRPVPMYVDGVSVGRFEQFELRVHSDAVTIVLG